MTNLQNQLAELRRQQDAVGDRINAALIAGIDTAPIRAEAAALSRDIRAIERAMAEAASQSEARSQEAISVTAAIIAADAENLVTSKLAALRPPAHP